MESLHEEDSLQPNPDQIYDLVYSDWQTHILKTAIQLDVFTAIANGLRTVEQIVSEKNWAMKPTRMLLNGLCPLGFLTKKGDEYFLTPTSEAFLVSSSKTYAGDSLQNFFACDKWQQLTNAITTGQRQIRDACTPEFTTLWEQDAAMESMRAPRIAESLEMWRTVGIDLDTTQSIRILDLASGCGIKSLVLAKRNPNINVTCADWAGVLKVAKKLSRKWGVLKKTNFLAGDISAMDYGESEFNAVLLGQITYYWSPHQNVSVLKKVHGALKPGGVVVINAPLADEHRCSSKGLILAVVLFLFSENGDVHTFLEYKNMLEKAGFSKITRHSESLVSARK